MINNIINYFESLNGVGQALFIVGVLLVITFIVLLIFVLKPEPKSKKVYGENSYTHSEAELEEKLKDIDNITDDDINNLDDFEQFIISLKIGSDPYSEERKIAMNQYCQYKDFKSTQRVCDFIEKKLIES